MITIRVSTSYLIVTNVCYSLEFPDNISTFLSSSSKVISPIPGHTLTLVSHCFTGLYLESTSRIVSRSSSKFSIRDPDFFIWCKEEFGFSQSSEYPYTQRLVISGGTKERTDRQRRPSSTNQEAKWPAEETFIDQIDQVKRTNVKNEQISYS